MTIKCFLDHFNTPEVHELSIGLEPAIKWEADFPGPRKYFRVFDGGLVLDRISRDRAVSLDNVQGVAMEITGSIEPGIRREAGDIDDKCIAFPAADRVAHVRVGGVWLNLIQMDRPLGVCEFEDHHYFVRSLNDLKRIQQVHRAGDA